MNITFWEFLRMWRFRCPGILAAVALLSATASAHSSVVRFDTVLGAIDVQLYDDAVPLTVANFLSYVNSGRYSGTFIHRSVPGFVIQGGGYIYDAPTNTAPHIPVYGPIPDEFGTSNVRGTIAMAKLGPNSATSEWFFNLANNGGTSPNGLDYQSGGFTVFGQVIGSGMTIVDSIANLPSYDLDGSSSNTFDTVPLRTPSSLSAGLVIVNNVQVLVPEPSTAMLVLIGGFFLIACPSRFAHRLGR